MPSYPKTEPANKHNVHCPRLPALDTPLGESDLAFSTTPALFQALKKKEINLKDGTFKQLAFVYSYRDAPQPPLSRDLCIIGVADATSLASMRKLVGDDDDDIPDCLAKSTIAVKRGDQGQLRQLEQKHQVNSRAFGQFMQRLRKDNVVAILATDKYQRFGILKPVQLTGEQQRYNKEDFFCVVYVGEISKVKKFLTGGKSAPRKQPTSPQDDNERPPTPDYPPPPPPEESSNGDNGDFEIKWKPPEEDDNNDNGGDAPMWKPPDDDDNGGGSSDVAMWQPPGTDQDDSGGGGGGDSGLWQPPGSSDADGGGGGGGDAFSWQPPSSNGFASFGDGGGGGGGESTNPWENPENAAAPEANGDDTAKRKRSDSDDDDNDNGDGGDGTFHSNKGAAAADAFYSGLTRTLDTRADSRLYHMRAFNGWVKATQIQDLDPQTKPSGKGRNNNNNKQQSGMRVLDLACGKGGDLGKWVLHPRGVREYVGSDVARGSLKDAAIRARGMRNRGLKHCTFTCADLGHDVPGRLRSAKQRLMQKLLTWSLQEEAVGTTTEPNFQMVRGGGILPDQMFDVVSIQFAIHYMMQTKERARRFFHTVSQLLEVGGNLIATTIDARVVIGHLMNLGVDLHFDENTDVSKLEPFVIKVGAGACRIKFEPEIVLKIVKSLSTGKGVNNCLDLFGLEYTFTLVEGSDHGAGVGDAVNLPEWLTPIPVLTSLAEEVGLELEYAHNFHEFYKQRKDPNSALNAGGAHNSLYSMKVLNVSGSISPDEWEISRLYCAVKFKKVREAVVSLDDEDDELEEEDEDDFEVDPQQKMKLMPMAMMKAKKSMDADAWAALSSDEKTLVIETEIRKMAKAAAG